MKLVTAQSFKNNLQFSCLKKLSDKMPGSSILNLCLPPGLRNFIKNNYWFFIDLQSDNSLQISSDFPEGIDGGLGVRSGPRVADAGVARSGLSCQFVDDRNLARMSSPAKRKPVEEED